MTDDNNVRYSGIGNEEHWTEDTGVDSSAKFVKAGYKDGGKLIGMVNLASNVLLVKDNRRGYSLSGEFPNWSISEVSHNVDVRGRMSTCAVADSVFILGRDEMQSIQTTAEILVGKVAVNLSLTETASSTRRRILAQGGRLIFGDEEQIYGNSRPIFNRSAILAENRNVHRNKLLDIGGSGSRRAELFSIR